MRPLTRALATATAACLALGAALVSPAEARPPREVTRHTQKVATSVGYGGAVSSVDPEASAAGLAVLARGGNAVDAAVTTAATLGVTEPYSAGIGGGGYLVYYDAKTRRVSTIDGRETAPASMPTDAFTNPATGAPYAFNELVTSGLSVGVPGTLATWQLALDRWGTSSLARAIEPARQVAQRGFVVDDTFRSQTLDNAARFRAFTSSRDLWLPNGDAPVVGSVFRNPDLADTYRLIQRRGLDGFYSGTLAADMARAVTAPPVSGESDLPTPAGHLSVDDLATYRAIEQAPTASTYRGYTVYGMGPSGSGGTTVGEALNILQRFDLSSLTVPEAYHRYFEASALAFADRGRYVGDPAFVDVPTRALLSDAFAAERACHVDPERAAVKPVAAGDVATADGRCDAAAAGALAPDTENRSTTNLTVADRWGNVVEYTLTIEQTGGSAITVPGRGFLLNNELTDFTLVWDAADPNRLEPGKRPRSSMSPTIVLKDGKPFLALGSPGGSTIITTVLQTLVNRIDLGMPIDRALAAPRATQRNTPKVTAEPGFIAEYGPAMGAFGHQLDPSGDSFTSAAEIGAATAIEFGSRGRLTAVSEPTRRGGGAALVVRPDKHRRG